MTAILWRSPFTSEFSSSLFFAVKKIAQKRWNIWATNVFRSLWSFPKNLFTTNFRNCRPTIAQNSRRTPFPSSKICSRVLRILFFSGSHKIFFFSFLCSKQQGNYHIFMEHPFGLPEIILLRIFGCCFFSFSRSRKILKHFENKNFLMHVR